MRAHVLAGRFAHYTYQVVSLQRVPAVLRPPMGVLLLSRVQHFRPTPLLVTRVLYYQQYAFSVSQITQITTPARRRGWFG